MVTDPHAHIIPEGFVEDVRSGKFGPALSVEQGPKYEILVTKSTVLSEERVHKNPLPRETYDVELRLQQMTAMGVERQILSVVPPCFYYTLDPDLTGELAGSFNNYVAGLTKKMPDRFSCMATVPLQDPDSAAGELERSVKMGHIGVEIGSNVKGKNLDDRSLDVFWEKVIALDVPVLIHPVDVMGAQDRLKDYYLRNLIGNPLDTTVAAACLIFGGVMERFPKLKVLLAHMGGFTPWIRGRWQHGYGERDEPKVNGARAPEKYIGRMYYDTVIHNSDCLEFGVRTLGSDNILYGTDYPFDMGDLGPAREIPGLSRLSESEKEKILSANAQKLYKL